jgi:2,4-diketo-3-deoxy-L-fuconate hydrolase
MRICRFEKNSDVRVGFYFDDFIVPLFEAAKSYPEFPASRLAQLRHSSALGFLPNGRFADTARTISLWLFENQQICRSLSIPTSSVRLLAPSPTPATIILLAGNYAAHIAEEGRIVMEREESFPYLFMKPPTAVNHPNAEIPIPRVSPDHIDYECELGVVIGKTAKHLTEANALDYVAGYTVVNDISDRQYKPFPNRKPRDRDNWFDWLHGKWHDGFFPMGPCITSAHVIPDPQKLKLSLRVNGEVRQEGSTGQMIFPVAALLEFITRGITLHPGDIIATGTPAGVGMTTGRYLKPGDVIDAAIEGIGVLHNVMATE